MNHRLKQTPCVRYFTELIWGTFGNLTVIKVANT